MIAVEESAAAMEEEGNRAGTELGNPCIFVNFTISARNLLCSAFLLSTTCPLPWLPADWLFLAQAIRATAMASGTANGFRKLTGRRRTLLPDDMPEQLMREGAGPSQRRCWPS